MSRWAPADWGGGAGRGSVRDCHDLVSCKHVIKFYIQYEVCCIVQQARQGVCDAVKQIHDYPEVDFMVVRIASSGISGTRVQEFG